MYIICSLARENIVRNPTVCFNVKNFKETEKKYEVTCEYVWNNLKNKGYKMFPAYYQVHRPDKPIIFHMAELLQIIFDEMISLLNIISEKINIPTKNQALENLQSFMDELKNSKKGGSSSLLLVKQPTKAKQTKRKYKKTQKRKHKKNTRRHQQQS
jgi:hypothetical protein